MICYQGACKCNRALELSQLHDPLVIEEKAGLPNSTKQPDALVPLIHTRAPRLCRSNKDLACIMSKTMLDPEKRGGGGEYSNDTVVSDAHAELKIASNKVAFLVVEDEDGCMTHVLLMEATDGQKQILTLTSSP